jgi:hypothetical protein
VGKIKLLYKPNIKMTRKELQELIKQEITSAAFNELKNKKKDKPETSRQNPDLRKAFKPRGLTEKEIDEVMFGEPKRKRGLNKVQKKATTIMESQERTPQITVREVNEFEDKFEQMIAEVPNASVTFDKQERSKGRSMLLVRRGDGIDAVASGTITVGSQGTIKWFFSLFGGFQMETQGPFDMEKETKFLFGNLYDFYNQWQGEWRSKLTTTSDEGGDEMAGDMGAGADMGTEIPAQGGQAGTPEATSL